MGKLVSSCTVVIVQPWKDRVRDLWGVNAMDIDRFSELTLTAHRSARQLMLNDFVECLLVGVRGVIAFDTAAWHSGGIGREGWMANAVHAFRLPAQVSGDLRSAREFARALGTASGTDRSFAVSAGDTRDPAAIFWARIGYHQLATLVAMDPRSRTAQTITFARRDHAAVFDQKDQRTLMLLAPHLTTAYDECRAWSLKRSEPLGRDTHRVRALVDRAGNIIEADPAFASLLRMEWPGWAGSVLPGPLARAVTASADPAYIGARVKAELTPLGSHVFVTLRERAPVDRLSPRERAVAEFFAKGLTYREISTVVAASPATVRNHLRGVYRKLEVTCKIELLAALE